MNTLRFLGLLAGVFFMPKHLASVAVLWVLLRLHPLLQWIAVMTVVLVWGDAG
jgi:hypothetical protein